MTPLDLVSRARLPIFAALVVALAGCSKQPAPAAPPPTPTSSSTQAAAHALAPTAAPAAPVARLDASKEPVPSVPSAPPVASVPSAPSVQPARAGATAPPHITFASTSHDFGRMSEVDVRRAGLRFTNTGGQRLVIDRVNTTCGCTVASLSKREFDPGESGTIDIEFDPAGPGERQKKYVNVLSNAAEGLVSLTILADVDAFVEIEPRMIELGVLEYGTAHSTTVRVSSPDKEFEIVQVESTNQAIEHHLLDAADSGAPRVIELTISPHAAWGALVGFLEVTVRARPAPDKDPITHMARVRIQGNLFGRLRADPDAFRFGIKPDESFTREVRVFRPDGLPFALSGTTLTLPGMLEPQIRVEPVSPSEYLLVLSARGPRLLQHYEGTVVFSTDVAGEERLEIPVSGVVRIDTGGVK